MGFLSDTFQRAFTPVRPAFEESTQAFSVGETWSGVVVTEEGALNIATVYACVRTVADAMAALPLLMQETGGQRARAKEHPTYWMLKEQPNEWMTSFEYRNTKYLHLLLWGNHFSEIDFDAQGRATGLFPIPPKRVLRKFMERGNLYYEVSIEGSGNVILPGWRIHHVKGIGSTGFMGYSPVRLAANSLGLALAAEEYGGRFFGSGGRPSGVLTHPTELGEEAYERLKNNWDSSLSKAHKVKILEEGMDYKAIGVPPEEAQFLQTRQFQLAEVARWFRVPPSMIGDLQKASYASGEQQALDFVRYCLGPWASNDEQALRRDVLVGADKRKYDIEYLFAGLLRGDAASRAQFYQTAMTHGGMTINEQRAAEGLPPVANGDALYMPLNVGRVLEDGALEAPTSPEQPIEEQPVAEPSEEPQEAEETDQAAEEDGQRALRLAEQETRALVAIEQRSAVAQAYIEPIAEVMGRTVRKETRDIRKQLHLLAVGGDINEFFRWLKAYEEELSPYMRASLGPVLRTMMLQVAGVASAEIGQQSPGLTEALRAWVEGYTERYGVEYGSESYGQLRALVEDAVQNGGDASADVETRLGEWEEKRPGKEARAESHNFSNAATVAVWEGYRVQKIRSRANQGACPFCMQLDGKVVGIREAFVKKGDVLHGEDGATMEISRDRGHPPYHGECTCGLSAEMG